jgi:SAM-dependent methyltransferase
MPKSITDLHWNDRALKEKDPSVVNIADESQRELETAFVLAHLPRGSRVLEVGCGNGFLTNILRVQAGFVDAFDYAENMVEQAKRLHGEINNRFFHDNILEPARVERRYDAVVCVRVLINLRNLDEQVAAVRNLHSLLSPRGTLILVEGYLNGFEALNELRRRCGMDPIQPASINFYARFEDLLTAIEPMFEVRTEMHTGMYDILTRVVYPLLVGPENATGHSEFHARTLPLARTLEPDDLRPYARVRGLVLRKC